MREAVLVGMPAAAAARIAARCDATPTVLLLAAAAAVPSVVVLSAAAAASCCVSAGSVADALRAVLRVFLPRLGFCDASAFQLKDFFAIRTVCGNSSTQGKVWARPAQQQVCVDC
jgi:hypothetical protein